MEPCPFGTPAFNSEGGIDILACGSWSCPRCGVVNALHWAERVRYGIALWRPNPAYFWTLTLPGWVMEPTKGYRELPKRFKGFRQSLTRAMGAWYYVAFVEEHPHRNFIPHFHIISLQKSPGRINDLANHSGFGYKASESEINGPKAAWYVSKYTTKQGYRMPRGFRRVRACQAWPVLPSPIYETTVFPMYSNETTEAYIARVSMLVGMDATLCELRYRQAQMETRARRMEVQTKLRQHPQQIFDKTTEADLQ